MPSCRRSAWSTTISSIATGTRRWRADGRTSRSAPRLAAHAVGPPTRSSRPLAARRRDRGHRARARARRALEWPDRGAAYFFGGAAFAYGRDDLAPRGAQHRPPLAARRAPARCARIRDRRSDQPVQGGNRRRLQAGGDAAPVGDFAPLRAAAGLAPGPREDREGGGPRRRLSRSDETRGLFRARSAAFFRGRA